MQVGTQNVNIITAQLAPVLAKAGERDSMDSSTGPGDEHGWAVVSSLVPGWCLATRL